jgi:hypothetical protein
MTAPAAGSTLTANGVTMSDMGTVVLTQHGMSAVLSKVYQCGACRAVVIEGDEMEHTLWHFQQAQLVGNLDRDLRGEIAGLRWNIEDVRSMVKPPEDPGPPLTDDVEQVKPESERWVSSFPMGGRMMHICNDCGALVLDTSRWRHDEYHDDELYAA